MPDEYTPETDSEAWEEEEICPEEVERIIRKLDEMVQTVESETIHAYLSEAYDKIEALVEWEEDDEQPGAEAA